MVSAGARIRWSRWWAGAFPTWGRWNLTCFMNILWKHCVSGRGHISPITKKMKTINSRKPEYRRFNSTGAAKKMANRCRGFGTVIVLGTETHKNCCAYFSNEIRLCQNYLDKTYIVCYTVLCIGFHVYNTIQYNNKSGAHHKCYEFATAAEINECCHKNKS